MAEAPRTSPSATPALAFRPDRLSAPRPRPDSTTLKDDKSQVSGCGDATGPGAPKVQPAPGMFCPPQRRVKLSRDDVITSWLSGWLLAIPTPFWPENASLPGPAPAVAAEDGRAVSYCPVQLRHVVPATAGLPARDGARSSERRSPRYTTWLNGLPVARASGDLSSNTPAGARSSGGVERKAAAIAWRCSGRRSEVRLSAGRFVRGFGHGTKAGWLAVMGSAQLARKGGAGTALPGERNQLRRSGADLGVKDGDAITEQRVQYLVAESLSLLH